MEPYAGLARRKTWSTWLSVAAGFARAGIAIGQTQTQSAIPLPLSHSVSAPAPHGVSSSSKQLMPIAAQMQTIFGLCLMHLVSAAAIYERASATEGNSGLATRVSIGEGNGKRPYKCRALEEMRI